MQEKIKEQINNTLNELDNLTEDLRRITNSINKHKRNLLELREALKENQEKPEIVQKDKTGKKILVVDDDSAIREMLKEFLVIEGYDVYFAEDGFAGLEMVLKIKPDMIILDVMMPKMDGFEFCDTVYQDPLTRDIPIIMLSAKNTEDDIKTGYFVGAKGYLSKPFSQKDLLQLINNLTYK